jgi:iron complex outermembrane receptor protein
MDSQVKRREERSAAWNSNWGMPLAAMLFALAGANESRAQATSPQTNEPEELAEVIVTGVRQSIDTAQEIKRQAAEVVDSIVAEDVGKLPDNNVADALARVTGIQIRRDSGEANSVLIRGLPNITTLLNGREVFTTIDRFIALADIPANMLQRVDVYKTTTAQQLEGGIAGLIDVRTRHPFDATGLHINGNVRAVYSDKSEATDPDLGFTISDTWNTGAGDFGALLGLSYQRRNYHEERAFNVAPEPQAGQFNPTNPPPVPDFQGPFVMGQIPIRGDRRRTSGNMSLEWRPNDNTKLYADGFVTNFANEFELDFFVGLPFLGNGDISGTVIPGTNQMKTLTNHDVFTITSTQANDNNSKTRQFALGGSYETDNNLRFSTDIARTTSRFELFNPIMDVATTVPDVFVDTNNNGTSLLRYGGAGFDITDGSNFNIVNWFDNFGYDEGDSIDWRGDVSWTPGSDGLLVEVSGGLRYADRKAEGIRSFVGAAPPFAASPTSSLPGIDGLSEPMASGGPQYDLVQWYTPSARYLLDNIDQVRRQTAGRYDRNAISEAQFAATNDPVTFARKLDPGSFFSDQEKTTALYTQARLKGDVAAMPWSGVIGLRAVKTGQTLRGNLPQGRVGGIIVYAPLETETDSTDFLPSANFKLNLTPEVIARLALSRTITRPNFDDLNPGVSLSTVLSNTTGLTGIGGNPNLKAVESDNVDLALEWYFARGGAVTATTFGRKFEGYVQPSFFPEVYGGDTFRVTRPQNTGSGRLMGLELAYQQFYDWLPSAFGGLGLQANATYSSGKTEDLVTGEDRTITGVSKWAYNIIGLYEQGPWSGRLAYNWRKRFIDAYAFAANPTGVYDLYVDDTAQMDGSVSYKLNDNFTLTFESVNILDTEFKDYFNDPNLFPRDTRRYDRTFEFGFRASF